MRGDFMGYRVQFTISDEATNLYNGAQALIALYIALGGATK